MPFFEGLVSFHPQRTSSHLQVNGNLVRKKIIGPIYDDALRTSDESVYVMLTSLVI